jgi:hypothetical protein
MCLGRIAEWMLRKRNEMLIDTLALNGSGIHISRFGSSQRKREAYRYSSSQRKREEPLVDGNGEEVVICVYCINVRGLNGDKIRKCPEVLTDTLDLNGSGIDLVLRSGNEMLAERLLLLRLRLIGLGLCGFMARRPTAAVSLIRRWLSVVVFLPGLCLRVQRMQHRINTIFLDATSIW